MNNRQFAGASIIVQVGGQSAGQLTDRLTDRPTGRVSESGASSLLARVRYARPHQRRHASELWRARADYVNRPARRRPAANVSRRPHAEHPALNFQWSREWVGAQWPTLKWATTCFGRRSRRAENFRFDASAAELRRAKLKNSSHSHRAFRRAPLAACGTNNNNNNGGERRQ